MSLEMLLEQGLHALQLDSTALQRQQLLRYVALLEEWNKKFNLTAVRKPQEMITRHLLDSLSIVKYLTQGPVLDVGTGPGLPGIPLSIFCPDIAFFLLDSHHKKWVFISHVVKSLSLSNVQCVHSRVQTYLPTQKFSTILSRAFAHLPEMVHLTAHLLAPQGRFLAMMGKAPPSSLVLADYVIEQVIALEVPGENANRHLAIIVRS